jgi:hypothetical protein
LWPGIFSGIFLFLALATLAKGIELILASAFKFSGFFFPASVVVLSILGLTQFSMLSICLWKFSPAAKFWVGLFRVFCLLWVGLAIIVARIGYVAAQIRLQKDLAEMSQNPWVLMTVIGVESDDASQIQPKVTEYIAKKLSGHRRHAVIVTSMGAVLPTFFLYWFFRKKIRREISNWRTLDRYSQYPLIDQVATDSATAAQRRRAALSEKDPY